MIVTPAELPATTEAGVPLSVRVAAAAAVTSIAPLVPLIVPVPVSAAVTVCEPTVVSV